jgi:hypothetical protein
LEVDPAPPVDHGVEWVVDLEGPAAPRPGKAFGASAAREPGTIRWLGPVAGREAAAASTLSHTDREEVDRPEVCVAPLARRTVPEVIPAQLLPRPLGPPREGKVCSC